MDAQVSTPWVGAIAKRCQQLIRQVGAKYDAEIMALDIMALDIMALDIMALEIMSDHGHLLCEVDPQFGIHRLVKNMKGASSHSLRKEFSVLRSHLAALWINSYFVSTVDGAPLAVIQQYVESQENV